MKQIYVDRRAVADQVAGLDAPPCMVVLDGDTEARADEVHILGPSSLVGRFNDPLPNGIRVWIETTSDVELVS